MTRNIDTISFAPRGACTRLTYEARVELIEIAQIADPILQLLLQRVGQLAIRGLRERLTGEARFDHPAAAPLLPS